MSWLKTIIVFIIAAMLAGGSAYAAVTATACGGDSQVSYSCNEAAYKACMKDMLPGLCPKGEETCDGLDLMLARRSCACGNLTDKADIGGQYGCEHVMTPEHFKDSFARPHKDRHCDAVLPYACDQPAYGACMQDLMATFCPKNNADCEYAANDSSLNELQLSCFCTSFTDKKPGTPGAEFCHAIKAPAEIKKAFVEAPPLYCDGYVHSPCDEKAYKACLQNFAVFCPNGEGCEGVGPGFAASCACDNLSDKSKKGDEDFCKNSMSPATLKAELLKEQQSRKK